MTGLLIVSHGSHSKKAEKEIHQLVKEIKHSSRISVLRYAFLEINKPTIPEGIEQCIKDGATNIFVILHFLNSGNHALKDVPRIVKETLKKHPKVSFHISRPIGLHPKIIELYNDVIYPRINVKDF